MQLDGLHARVHGPGPSAFASPVSSSFRSLAFEIRANVAPLGEDDGNRSSETPIWVATQLATEDDFSIQNSGWKRLSVLARSSFQRGQVHLDHPHHGFHGFGVIDQLADIAWHDLPAQAEAVYEPATGHGLAAFDQLAPVAVDLFLGVAPDEEREGGVELMSRAAIEKDHLLALKLDRDSSNLAHAPGTNAFGSQLIEPASVREDAQVKLGGFFGVVVEPEEWRKFIHGRHDTSLEVTSEKNGLGKLWLLRSSNLPP